jgi:hypothetical protein
MLNSKELKLLALLAPLSVAGAVAQNPGDRQAALEGVATRTTAPLTLPPSSSDAGGTNGSGAQSEGSETSDAGLQRVVTKKERAVEFDAGTTFSYLYRSNPLSTNGALSKAVKSGVADIGTFVSASLGNYEILNGVFTPRIGGGISEVSLTKRVLDFVDYRTQRVFLQGDLKYANGWTFSSSLEYSSITSSKFNTEDYKEWFPSLTVAKSWAIDNKSLLRASVSSGHRFTEVDSLGGSVPGVTAHRLDNWSNSFNVAYYRELFFGITGQVFGELSNRSYYNGQNSDRNDLSKTVGSSLSYNWRVLRFLLFWNYTQRESTLQINEYRNLDAGASVTAALRF